MIETNTKQRPRTKKNIHQRFIFKILMPFSCDTYATHTWPFISFNFNFIFRHPHKSQPRFLFSWCSLITQKEEKMEMTTQSFSYAKSKSLSPFIPPKSTVLSHKSVNFVGYNCLPRKLKCSAKQLRIFGAVSASDSDTSPTDDSVRWLLQPIG